MDHARTHPDVLGDKSRTCIDMKGTAEDYKKLFDEMSDLSDCHIGCPKMSLTNEQEWILYTFWPLKRQEDVARLMHINSHTLRREYERLKAQGGPKGEKPAWI